MRRTLIGFSWVVLLVQGCSVDIVPVHSSRVNAVKLAEQPHLRGPGVPGAFQHSWKFGDSKGYLFDPSQVFSGEGVIRLKFPDRQGAYYGEQEAIVITGSGKGFEVLDTFSEVTGPHHQGRLVYQLSRDNSAWYYHNGKAWVPAGPTHRHANSAADIAQRIPKFHLEVGTGSLYVRIFLVSPTGREPVELREIRVGGVAPRNDGW